MTTIMSVGNSEGSRSCDATCHNASRPNCDCICRGRYHGKKDQAQELLQKDLESGVWGKSLQAAAQTVLPAGVSA